MGKKDKDKDRRKRADAARMAAGDAMLRAVDAACAELYKHLAPAKDPASPLEARLEALDGGDLAAYGQAMGALAAASARLQGELAACPCPAEEPCVPCRVRILREEALAVTAIPPLPDTVGQRAFRFSRLVCATGALLEELLKARVG